MQQAVNDSKLLDLMKVLPTLNMERMCYFYWVHCFFFFFFFLCFFIHSQLTWVIMIKFLFIFIFTCKFILFLIY